MSHERPAFFSSLRIGLLGLGLILVSIAAIGTQRSSGSMASTEPAPRLQSYHWMSLARWFEMHAADVALAEQGEARVVFLGDSITEAWAGAGAVFWEEKFAPLQAVNFGIGGDMTQNVLWRLRHGAVSNLDPEAVVLLIGTNNFGHTQAGPSEVALGVRAVVRDLRQAFPDARILLFGIFPRDAQPDTANRRKIAAANAEIASLHDGQHIFFEDIGSRFLEEDGTISAEVMPDALHLSEEGYRRWADAIEPYLLRWLARSADIPAGAA